MQPNQAQTQTPRATEPQPPADTPTGSVKGSEITVTLSALVALLGLSALRRVTRAVLNPESPADLGVVGEQIMSMEAVRTAKQRPALADPNDASFSIDCGPVIDWALHNASHQRGECTKAAKRVLSLK